MELRFIPRFALGIFALFTALLGFTYVIAGWNWFFGPISLIGWFLLLGGTLTRGKKNYEDFVMWRGLVLSHIQADPCHLQEFYARVWDAYRKTKGMLDREAAYTLAEWHLQRFVDEGYAQLLSYPDSSYPFVALTSEGSAYKNMSQ